MKIFFTPMIIVAIANAALVNAAAVVEDAPHDHMMVASNYSKVMLDQFEQAVDQHGNDGQRWDAQAWYGGDFDKLWLKSEGERNQGDTESAELQALYSHAISPFFDLQVGARHDFQPQPTRDWVVLGMQGLAPYFFETEATLFIGNEGRSALRLKAQYDLLITQQLILAPEIETNFFGKNDSATGSGSGLSNLEFGLRLRYEFAHEFAPYIGAVWTHQFGETADLTRADGGDIQSVQWVAGLKLWY